MSKQVLGLIAGNGKFPILFAREARAKNYKVIAGGIKGDTSPLLRFFVDKIEIFNVGDLGKLFSFLKREGVTKAIMAGQASPRNLFKNNLFLDEEFKELFDAIRDRKADTIFMAIADKLQEHGIHLVDSTFLLKDYLAPKGTLTRRGPTIKELEDIEFGKTIAKAMGGMDVGQTVVIKEKAIVAIEAMEGTDKAIVRGGKIAKSGAVIIKMSKPEQDLRFDVPVIGPRTVRSMIRSKAACLAVEAGKTIIVDKDSMVKLANRSDICIVAAQL